LTFKPTLVAAWISSFAFGVLVPIPIYPFVVSASNMVVPLEFCI